MLSGLKVLDLTDERGLLAGRMLADLGADVVQVEPPTGSSARDRAPLTGTTSWFWEAYAAGKRSVVADLGTSEGQQLVRRLAAVADVLLTTWLPEEAHARGLGSGDLQTLNPRLVQVAVTPFGQDGPKAQYADSDLVLWAAGGPLEPHRDGDRPPLRISVPQAYLHAAADAAAGALLALAARDRTGRGQLVDVSAQASLGVATLARVLADPVGHPDASFVAVAKGTDQSGSGSGTSTQLKKWSCKDGLVELHLAMGPATGAFTNNFFAWMRDEGGCDDALAAVDWRRVPELLASGELRDEDLSAARRATKAFLATHDKAEILEAAVRYRLLCIGICDVGDIAASAQLEARDFFAEVRPGVRVPGSYARVTGAPGPRVRGAAPRVGQHTEPVTREWLSQPAPVAGPAGTKAAALDGLKVLDLSWVVAGPLIGRALADFGATVVRVESSRRVETARLMQPFYGAQPGPENSALYVNCNAGKLGVTLDLSTDEGREVVRDLVRWSDVVVESFSPGQMARWDLDYSTLARDKPDLVMLSTSLMGQTGPHTALAGYGNIGASLSGFQHLVGWPDRPPVGPFGPYTDYVGPRFALVTLLAALRQRAATGAGCHIDVSQVETGVFFLSPELAAYFADGSVPGARGNADREHAPHGVHACLPDGDRERFVAVAVTDDAEWSALSPLLGLAGEARFASRAGRLEHRGLLEDAVAAWTSTQTAEQVEARLQAAGVPAHVAASSPDFASDAQLVHRGHVVRLPHVLHGEAVVEGPRYLLSDTPGVVRSAAPTFGEHNEYVLGELLGYGGERIAALEAAGVLR